MANRKEKRTRILKSRQRKQQQHLALPPERMDEPPSQYSMSPADPLDTPRTKQLKDLRQKRLAYYNTPASSQPNATPEPKRNSAKSQEKLSAVLPKQQSRSPRLSSTVNGQRAPGPGNRSKELKQSVSTSNNARQSLQKNNSAKASLKKSNIFIEDDSSILETDSSLFTEPTVTDYTNYGKGNGESHYQDGRNSDSNDLRLSLGSTILDTKNRGRVQKGVSGSNEMDLRLSLGSSLTGTKAMKNSDPENLHLSLDSTVVQQNPWKKNGSGKYDLRSSIGSSTAVEETGNIFLKGGQNVDFGSSFDSTLVDTTPSSVADYDQRLMMQEQPTPNIAQLSLDSEVDSENTHPFAFNKFLMNSDQSDLRSSIESGTTAANTYFNSMLKRDMFETSDTQNAEESKLAVNKSVTFFLEEEDENGNGEPAVARENQSDLVHQLMKDHQQKFGPNQFGLTDSMQSSLVTGVDNHSDVNFVKISKHFVNLDDSSIITGTESEIQSSIAPPSYDQIHQQGVRISGNSLPPSASQAKNEIPKSSNASRPVLNSQNLKQNGGDTQVTVGSSGKDGHSSVLDTDISSVVGLDNQYKEGYIKGLRIALGEEKFQEMLDNSSELQEILNTLDKVAQVDGKPGPKKTTVEKQVPNKSSAPQMVEDQGTVISDVLTDVTQDYRMQNQVPVHQGQEQVQFGNFDARINLPSDKTVRRAPTEMNNNVAWFKGQHSVQIAQPKPLRKSAQGFRSRDVDVPAATHVGLNSQVEPDMRLNIMEEFEHIDPSVLSPTLSSPYSYRAEDRGKPRTGVLTMKAPPVQDGGQRTPRVKKCAFSAEEIYKQAFAEAESFLNEAKKTTETPAPGPNVKHYPYGFREPTPPRKSKETPTHSHFHSRPVGPVPQKSGSETGRSSGPSEIIGTGPPKVLSQSDFESRSSDTGLSQEDHMKAVRDHHQYQRAAIIRQVTEQQKKPGYTSSSLDRYFSSLRDINNDVAFDPIPEWSDVAPKRGGRGNHATQDVRLSHKVFSAIRESTPQSSLEDEVSGDYENYFLQVVRKSLQDSSVFLDNRSMDQFLSNIRGKSDNVDDFMRNLQHSLDSDRFQELVKKSGEFESESDGTKMAASSDSDVSKVNKLRQSQKSLGKSTDYDGETLYTSVSGVTDKFDRLHLDRMLVRDELIGDQSKLNVLLPARHGNSETEQMAFDGENGQRMVVVCPDCATLNKQYVTWCLDCGCVLIGVDPVPLKPKKQSKRSKEKSRKPNGQSGSSTRPTSAARPGSGTIGARPGSAKTNSRPTSAKDVKNSRPASAKKSSRRELEQLKTQKVSKALGKSSDDYSNDSSSGSGQDRKDKPSSSSLLRKSKELYRSNSKEETAKVDYLGSVQNGVLKPVPQHKPVLHDQVQQAIEILHHGMESPKARHPNLKNELSLQLSMSSSMDTGLNGENGKVNGLKKGNPLGMSVSSDFQEVEIFERKMDTDLRRQSRQDADVPTINVANLSDEEKPLGDADVSDDIPNFIALDDDSTIVDEEDVSTLADVSTMTDRIEDQRHLDQNVPDEELSHQEFLARIQRDGRVKKMPVPTPSSSNANNSRPKSAGKYRTAASMVDPPKGRPVSASKVRTSIEADPYKRHWDRSSTAWGSFAANELNTWSSTNMSNLPAKKRPISAKTRKPGGGDRTPEAERRKTTRPASAGQRGRPTSAGEQRNPGPSSGSSQKIMSRMAERLAELNSDPLTRPEVVEAWTAVEQPVVVKPKVPHVYHNAEPMSSETYVHHVAMSPRVARGAVSFLLCLPDELLLHILSYLNHQDLTRVARTCSQMYRITQDETLWKHIMLRNKSNLCDDHLDEIGSHSPLSICLIQCLGDNITSHGLRNLFRHCADTLQELNIMGCSRGELTGENIIFHAAAKCHNLTHVDMSWTNVNDTVLISMANCSRRLVSLNISGCQAITDDGLIGVVKKHGDSLRSIEAFGCFNITPKGIKALGQYCRKLVTLNIGQCYKVTDASVSQLASSLEKVKHLDFRGCKQVKDSCMRKIVRCCKNLESITLANCPGATDLSLVELATYLPSIRYVDMSGCKLVTDVGMRSIAHNCYLVEHLDLSSTGVTNKSVSLLASYCSQRLQVLKLNFCKDVTEQGLVKLARNCKRLKLMHLYGCKNIRNLDKILRENKDLIIERDTIE